MGEALKVPHGQSESQPEYIARRSSGFSETDISDPSRRVIEETDNPDNKSAEVIDLNSSHSGHPVGERALSASLDIDTPATRRVESSIDDYGFDPEEGINSLRQDIADKNTRTDVRQSKTSEVADDYGFDLEEGINSLRQEIADINAENTKSAKTDTEAQTLTHEQQAEREFLSTLDLQNMSETDIKQAIAGEFGRRSDITASFDSMDKAAMLFYADQLKQAPDNSDLGDGELEESGAKRSIEKHLDESVIPEADEQAPKRVETEADDGYGQGEDYLFNPEVDRIRAEKAAKKAAEATEDTIEGTEESGSIDTLRDMLEEDKVKGPSQFINRLKGTLDRISRLPFISHARSHLNQMGFYASIKLNPDLYVLGRNDPEYKDAVWRRRGFMIGSLVMAAVSLSTIVRPTLAHALGGNHDGPFQEGLPAHDTGSSGHEASGPFQEGLPTDGSGGGGEGGGSGGHEAGIPTHVDTHTTGGGTEGHDTTSTQGHEAAGTQGQEAQNPPHNPEFFAETVPFTAEGKNDSNHLLDSLHDVSGKSGNYSSEDVASWLTSKGSPNTVAGMNSQRILDELNGTHLSLSEQNDLLNKMEQDPQMVGMSSQELHDKIISGEIKWHYEANGVSERYGNSIFLGEDSNFKELVEQRVPHGHDKGLLVLEYNGKTIKVQTGCGQFYWEEGPVKGDKVHTPIQQPSGRHHDTPSTVVTHHDTPTPEPTPTPTPEHPPTPTPEPTPTPTPEHPPTPTPEPTPTPTPEPIKPKDFDGSETHVTEAPKAVETAPATPAAQAHTDTSPAAQAQQHSVETNQTAPGATKPETAPVTETKTHTETAPTSAIPVTETRPETVQQATPVETAPTPSAPGTQIEDPFGG